MRSIAFALAVLVILNAAIPTSLARGGQSQQPPNIVLIVLDDLGFEKLDWWPAQLDPCDPSAPPFPPPSATSNPPTPALQLLAAEGVIFTNAWASPVCSPSRMQILTGRHSHRTGVGNIVDANAMLTPDDTELLLPEVLRIGNAYRTGAFGKWHVVPGCFRTHPTVNGFEIFQGQMQNVGNRGTQGGGHHLFWEKVDSTAMQPPCPVDPPTVTEWSSTVTRQDAIAWIAGLPANEPFFAYVAFNAPHEPLQVPPLDLVSQTTRQRITSLGYVEGDFPASAARDCSDPLYADHFGRHVEVFNWMIEAVDKEIKLIRRALENLGRLEDTVIFVVSDNGTSRRAMDCPLNAEHGKTSVYQLGTRVPLIVWGPRVIDPLDQGTQRDELVSVVDLWTTIAETTGMVDPGQWVQPGRTLDSKSFRHLFDRTVPPPPAEQRRESALVEQFNGLKRHWVEPANRFKRAVVNEAGYRYVHQSFGEPPPTGNDPEEFLHLPTDPDELENLATFTGFTDGQSPCGEGACFLPPPGCIPPGPCKPGYGLGRSLQGVACVPGLVCAATSQPLCDLNVLFDIFDRLYAPLFCVCSTSD